MKPPAVRERILEALTGEGGDLRSGAVIDRLGLKDNRQSVYSALNQLSKQGKIEKDSSGTYSVAEAS